MWKQLETGSRAYQEKQFRDVVGETALGVSVARPLKTYKPQDTWIHQELVPGGRLTASVPIKRSALQRVLMISGTRGVPIDVADRNYMKDNTIYFVHFPRETTITEAARKLKDIPNHLGFVFSKYGIQARIPRQNVQEATATINPERAATMGDTLNVTVKHRWWICNVPREWNRQDLFSKIKGMGWPVKYLEHKFQGRDVHYLVGLQFCPQ